ncbi:hypothetical protein AALO_G00021760 [Alosa alosa]|uniref:HTH CENPB-type domain-containing protein n=1 Tax=Alosa alosa TaxID=278164 RepID=A0AAV6HDM3_9TELE|nr:hypothetical protein AALO_G00021760 [Alosa alosa]
MPEEEEALVGYIFWMAAHRFPITRSVALLLATEICKASGRTSPLVNMEKGLSKMWWTRFRARHPTVASRRPDPLDRERVHGATVARVDELFHICQALYQQHWFGGTPAQIYNCDETGFGDKGHSRQRVLCRKGLRAAGDHQGPLCYIYLSKNIKISGGMALFHYGQLQMISERGGLPCFVKIGSCRNSRIMLEQRFMVKLNYYTPKLITLMKAKGGAVGNNLRPFVDKLTQNQSIEERREAVIRGLILYLGEKEEDLFEDCQDHLRSDVTQHILKILVVLRKIQWM